MLWYEVLNYWFFIKVLFLGLWNFSDYYIVSIEFFLEFCFYLFTTVENVSILWLFILRLLSSLFHCMNVLRSSSSNSSILYSAAVALLVRLSREFLISPTQFQSYYFSFKFSHFYFHISWVLFVVVQCFLWVLWTSCSVLL